MRQTHPQLNTRRSVALILATLLLAALLVPSLSVPVSAAESGTCGDGLTWSLSAGTLTISGKGSMTEYQKPALVPWYGFREQICRIVLPEGLTNIGSLAFYECKHVNAVYLPDSVTRIGEYAFAECSGIESLRLGLSVTAIDAAAFYGCVRLASVSLPANLQVIGNQAFFRCESLAAVTIPSALKTMGTSVFAYCKDLVRAEVLANFGVLPAWTFYGCEKLTAVILPGTIGELENYAFKNCTGLETIYFQGDADKKQEIQSDLAKDVPTFEQRGMISSASPAKSTTAGVLTNNGDGTVTQQNTTVESKGDMMFISVVEHTRKEDFLKGGSYIADLTVTVENKDAWSEAVSTISKAINEMTDLSTNNRATLEDVNLTIYVKTEGGIDSSLVEELAGCDVKLKVVSQNGSESRMECEELKIEDLSGSYDYSHSVEETPADKVESLGTEDCFQIKFNESASVNSEILVQLPKAPPHSTAYLYQVEKDNTLTRLQATVVDDDGNAHFYVAAVDKDTEYIVGVNVPGENSDDAIIPDEMLSHYGNAVDRLQKIDYVITGRESSWGLNAAQVTWIMLGVLAVCIIAVGTVMAIWNHRRLKRGYVPDMAEYEDADSAEAGT